MATLRFGLSLLLSAQLLAACQSSNGGAVIGDDPEPQQTQLPQIKVNLPPPPSFQKDNPPETYPDASYSVFGVKKNEKATLNKQVRVKGFLLELYQCPTCPKGTECKPCLKPHFYLADRLNGPKDKALLVTDYPKDDPETKKPIAFEVGAQYYVSGTFSKSSPTGFSNSEGLLVYAGHKAAAAPAPEK